MFSIGFYPKNLKAIKTTKIYVYIFQDEPKPVRLPIDLSVPPSKWSRTLQKLKPTYFNAFSDNKYLEVLRTKIRTVYDQKRLEGAKPTREDYELVIKAKPQGMPKTFLEYFHEYIETAKKRDGTTKSDATKRQMNSSLRILEEFAITTRTTLNFGQMNRTFYEKFADFLFEQKDYESNTVGSRTKHIKAFLNWCVDEKLMTDLQFQKWPVIKINKPVIRHDDLEVEKMREHDLSSNPRLERARDLYLLQIGCGLRISDFNELGEENFKQDRIVVSTQKVHGTHVEIPYMSLSREIIKKYDGKLPKMSEQRYRDYLKEALREIGINEPTEKIRYFNNKRDITIEPKYKLCSTHTARRTFISRCLDAGIPPHIVASYTGQTVEVMLKYSGVTDRVKQDYMKKMG